MGSACSSGQASKDKDSVSTRSEGSEGRYRAKDENGGLKHQEENTQIQEPPRKQSISAGLLLGVQQTSQPPQHHDADKMAAPTTAERDPSAISAPKENKVVIFLCAPDSEDCKVEKSLLHNEVYPELRQNLAKSGFELHIVDLHWATQDLFGFETAELSAHEITRLSERSYIVPVIFLNDSLGSPLLPRTLECADFESLFVNVPPGDTTDKCEIERVLSLMLSKFSNELKDTYLTTLVEQEVQRTVLMSSELASRCIWLQRTAHTPASSLQKLTPGEEELKRRLEQLKNTCKELLEESNFLKVTPAAGSHHSEQPEYLSTVVAQLRSRLSAVIQTIIEEQQGKVCQNGLNIEKEVLLHKYFAQNNSLISPSRQPLIEIAQKYDSDGVLIFTGAEGCGKSALLAKMSCVLEGEVIYRHVGLTRYTSTLVNTLYSLTVQMEGLLASGGVWPHYPHSLEVYAPLLYEMTKKLAERGQRPLVIIIDGLDQFKEFGLNVVNWIPRVLPENMKLIVSICDSSDLLVSRLKTHLEKTNAQFLPVGELSKEEAERMFLSSTLEYNQTTAEQVQGTILSCLAQSTIPLYVKTLAWEATWCSEYGIELEPPASLREQMTHMLGILETILGKEQVEKVLSLLCSSKWGLTDSEMIDLMASDTIFHTSAGHLGWTGCFSSWSKMTRLLGPFLRTGESGGVCIAEPALAKAAKGRYRSRIASSTALLYRYYSGQLWEDGKKIKSRMSLQPTRYGETYNRRKLEELPYLTVKTQGGAARYTLDPDWILDKLCGATVHQLLEDLYMENENEDVRWLQRFLETNAPQLDYDGRQFYAQIARYRFPLNTQLGQMLQGPPRIVSLIESEVDEEDDLNIQIDLIKRLPHNQSFVVTVSTASEELAVWDISRCKRVRLLSGVPQPSAIEMVDDYKCVVLCKRELRVYDLNSGKLLTVLKGVMNQKMPYFGLHDSDHLVALSRNRMYVNLMNLTSGDCVTTFKAGEDRFLNSLLVSGDGRILVCGDETQKPMPLLVWNLSSRKLLYDLRIPQHDFVTALSAITHNGGYVAVVAKEVDDPSTANYIVVYDLQSGTLFKKWKRGVDAVSVDISSTESCVVSGHTDLTIIVWDLITGNCRWRLRGHRSAPDFLRFSPSGSILLTRSTSQDTALRLWALQDGSLLSVFSPDSRVQASELTDLQVGLSLMGEESEASDARPDAPPRLSALPRRSDSVDEQRAARRSRRLTSLQLQGPGYTYRARRTQFKLVIPKGMQPSPVREEDIYGDESCEEVQPR